MEKTKTKRKQQTQKDIELARNIYEQKTQTPKQQNQHHQHFFF